MHKYGIVVLFAFWSVCVTAQTPPKLVVFVDPTPILIDAPAPFVETSRILPMIFAQRARALSAHNRLLAWFIPTQSLKEYLKEKQTRCRVLQVQVIKEMEAVRHDAQSFKSLRDEALTRNAIPEITEADTDTLFAMCDLSNSGKMPVAKKSSATRNSEKARSRSASQSAPKAAERCPKFSPQNLISRHSRLTI
jgi:cell division inhibitor SulA